MQTFQVEQDGEQTRAVVHAPRALVTVEQAELSVDEVLKHMHKVQEIKKRLMTKGHHYGIIPGVEKPTLLKPGAEILAMAFRLAAEYKIEIEELPRGHRIFRTYSKITHITTGLYIASGVGECSTMETKYRYRHAEPTDTGKPVPKEYWDLRRAKKWNEAIAKLGGKEFKAQKYGAEWRIAKISEAVVENPSIADVYNTCIKMSKKRSYIDGVITATGGSEDWTQDLDETLPDYTFSPNSHEPTRGAAEEEPSENPPKAKETAAKPHNEDIDKAMLQASKLEDWRDVARMKGKSKPFEARLRQLLSNEGKATFEELTEERQGTIVSAMAEIVRRFDVS